MMILPSTLKENLAEMQEVPEKFSRAITKASVATRS